MSKKVWYWIFGSLSAALLTTGVVIYAKRQVDLLLDFCYRISDFKFSYLNSSGIGFNFILNVKNQSDISVALKKYDFNVSLNGITLANIKSNSTQTWAAQAVSPISFSINVKWANLKVDLKTITKLVAYYISDRSKLSIKITGNISAEALKIPVNDYPVNLEFTLAEILAPNSKVSTCKI